MFSATRRRRTLAITAGLATSALLVAACSNNTSDGTPTGGSTAGGNGGAAAADTLVIGTTDKITTIDPAGEYDNGSFAVINQVYPFLLNTPYGSPDVKPDIAASASFTSPTEYTVKLKPGLKFANGDDLTSSDVKFSFDRVQAIGASGADGGNGPVVPAVQPRLDRRARRDDRGLPPQGRRTTRRSRRSCRARPARSSTSRCSPDGPHPGRRHRQGQRLRRPVLDHQLPDQPADLVQGEPELPGHLRRTEDPEHQRDVLRRRVEPQARRAAGRGRRRVPLAVRDGHRRPAQRQEPPGRRRARR